MFFSSHAKHTNSKIKKNNRLIKIDILDKIENKILRINIFNKLNFLFDICFILFIYVCPNNHLHF